MGLETGVEDPCLAGLAALSFAERDLLDGTPKLSPQLIAPTKQYYEPRRIESTALLHVMARSNRSTRPEDKTPGRLCFLQE